jgi:hypothetical protein
MQMDLQRDEKTRVAIIHIETYTVLIYFELFLNLKFV